MSHGESHCIRIYQRFPIHRGLQLRYQRIDRLHEAAKTSVIWSTLFCVLFGLIMALFSTAVISQFTKGVTEMIRIGRSALFATAFLLCSSVFTPFTRRCSLRWEKEKKASSSAHAGRESALCRLSCCSQWFWESTASSTHSRLPMCCLL